MAQSTTIQPVTRSSISLKQYFPLNRNAVNKNGINRRREASAEVAWSDLSGCRKNMSLKRKLRDMEFSDHSNKKLQTGNNSSSVSLGRPSDPKTGPTSQTITDINYAETISSNGEPESSKSSPIPIITSDLPAVEQVTSDLSANVTEWKDDGSEETDEEDWSALRTANDKTWQELQQLVWPNDVRVILPGANASGLNSQARSSL
jgi:hypothetical protein